MQQLMTTLLKNQQTREGEPWKIKNLIRSHALDLFFLSETKNDVNDHVFDICFYKYW